MCRRREKHFWDGDICKYWLCGFCPYEEFRRTKNDMGDCPKVHDETCRAEWQALSEREKEKYGYERDLLRRFERHLSDLQKRIDANTARLSATKKPAFLAEDVAALEAIDKEIADLLAKAAALGEEGEVDEAEAATKQAEILRQKRKDIEREADVRSGNSATRGLLQSVCPVSGLIINDEESRLRDHHLGRNYNAWKKLHAMHAELKAKLQARREGKDHTGRYGRREDRDPSYRSRRDRSRSRDRRRRSRSRSGDRYRRGRGTSGDDLHDRKGGNDWEAEHRAYGGVENGTGTKQRTRDHSPEEGEVNVAG